MKESVLLHKHRYLTTFFANRALNAEERKREVMMDESYIHEHYHRNNDSIWDPNDDQDIQFGKAPAKGRRYCFAAAIQGPNPCVSDAVLNQDKAGLVPGSVWAFCPQKAKDHGGDYHKVFNGQNFVKWWKEQLLPNLKQKSLIMLDNAKYHKVYGDQVPKVYKHVRCGIRVHLGTPRQLRGIVNCTPEIPNVGFVDLVHLVMTMSIVRGRPHRLGVTLQPCSG